MPAVKRLRRLDEQLRSGAARRLTAPSTRARNRGAAPCCSAQAATVVPTLSTSSIADLEVSADDPELTAKAAAIYHAHGCKRPPLCCRSGSLCKRARAP